MVYISKDKSVCPYQFEKETYFECMYKKCVSFSKG